MDQNAPDTANIHHRTTNPPRRLLDRIAIRVVLPLDREAITEQASHPRRVGRVELPLDVVADRDEEPLLGELPVTEPHEHGAMLAGRASVAAHSAQELRIPVVPNNLSAGVLDTVGSRGTSSSVRPLAARPSPRPTGVAPLLE
ncbi:hypothetical protein EDF39_0577 [Frondihabitans sp. PhB161]|nr:MULTISPECIES: hypothetical protein [unclassified Frondihabitans]RPE77907.1 hypothetical protein EDF37_0576 [Frondihabitans sp. PhB153]RPF08187.1 hypothetical protein EDF39_0577 [Frondihabitans sp. PhB161]